MDEKSFEEELEDVYLEQIASQFKAIGNKHRLNILLSLRGEFIEGIKWPRLREITELSDGALKQHIDVLIRNRLIGKSKGGYRITEAGMASLADVDEFEKTIEDHVKDPVFMKNIMTEALQALIDSGKIEEIITRVIKEKEEK